LLNSLLLIPPVWSFKLILSVPRMNNLLQSPCFLIILLLMKVLLSLNNFLVLSIVVIVCIHPLDHYACVGYHPYILYCSNIWHWRFPFLELTMQHLLCFWMFNLEVWFWLFRRLGNLIQVFIWSDKSQAS